MASKLSSIESHPQRQKIIEAILAGSTLRQITAWANPPVSTASICRFKRNALAKVQDSLSAANLAIANRDTDLPPDSTIVKQDVSLAVTRAALTAAADPFIARIQKHQATLDAAITDAAADKDARGIASLVSTDLKGLELHARLAGRLDTPAQQTNIMIVCPAGAPEPAVTLEPDAVVIDIGKR
jgi:hypothetical protein